ncbi:aminoacyl-tRNA deacylase [Paeniglutamicibacter gangotriensis]|uniref:aminoacyl-tRNA deacylase n=1 Tax=Paeniglutamicibacter gangotriensis TaxID=254787 RepID=UPI0037CA9C8C
MTDQLPAGVERMLNDAATRRLEVSVVNRPPANSLAEAAALLGILPRSIIKSLVLKRQDGTFLFALIPGDRVISWPKLRALLGANKLSMPSSDAAKAATGYERGTITPLGSSTPWPVVADLAVASGRICIGSGSHGHSAFVDSAALITALGAIEGDISDPDPQFRSS